MRASVTYEDCVAYLAKDSDDEWLETGDYLSLAARLVSHVFKVADEKLMQDVRNERENAKIRNING